MPHSFQCPFFRSDKGASGLNCDGAELKFPDLIARRSFVAKFCANPMDWERCPIAIYLKEAYERMEKFEKREQQGENRPAP